MINETYNLWCQKAVNDPDLIAELKELEGNNELISDAFYKSLEKKAVLCYTLARL